MKVAYCTIASANYLSRVHVLETSLKQYNPGATLEILLCEWPHICKEISEKTGRPFYSPAEIGCEDWLHMAFYYDITEYNTALKPFFLETLIKKGYEAVFYFDPDIEVFGSFKEMESLIPRYDVVLTPHVCKPFPDDNRTPLIESYIRAGQFNLGYVGVSGSSESLELLKWWQSVCIEKCIFHHAHKFFVDQFWAAIFPSFIEKAYILRDPQYNVAYWNIFQRNLELKDGKWLVDGGELKFFHFSGLHKKDLTKVSVHQNRVTAPEGSDLYRILSGYLQKIKKQEWAMFDSHPYSFATYTNGEEISGEERKNFLYMSALERKTVPNPFDRPDVITKIIRLDIDRGETSSFRFINRIRSFYLRNLAEQARMFITVVRTDGIMKALWYTVRFVLKAVAARLRRLIQG